MITHYVFISLVILESRTYLLLPSLGHIRKRYAFVDNFEFTTNKAFDVCIRNVNAVLIGRFLEIS